MSEVDIQTKLVFEPRTPMCPDKISLHPTRKGELYVQPVRSLRRTRVVLAQEDVANPSEVTVDAIIPEETQTVHDFVEPSILHANTYADIVGISYDSIVDSPVEVVVNRGVLSSVTKVASNFINGLKRRSQVMDTA